MASGKLFWSPEENAGASLKPQQTSSTRPSTIDQSSCNAYLKMIKGKKLYSQTLSLKKVYQDEICCSCQHFSLVQFTLLCSFRMLGKTFSILSLKTSCRLKGDGITQEVEGPCSLRPNLVGLGVNGLRQRQKVFLP